MLKLPYTEVIDLKSEFNDFEYRLFIRLLNNYKNDDKHYPVIFVLDPEYLFTICYDIRMIYENYIVVGIGHKDLDFLELDKKDREYKNETYRPRDFLPWKLDENIFSKATSEDFKAAILNASGKANNFAKFITKQVITLIDSKYRTTNDRILIGHSFGGVFTCYILVCFPDIFTKYIAIAPVLANLYYQDKLMFDVLAKKTTDTKKLAYFSAGSDEKDERMEDYIGTIEKSCAEIAKLPSLTSKFEIITGESHASVVTPSIWRGLKFFDSCK